LVTHHAKVTSASTNPNSWQRAHLGRACAYVLENAPCGVWLFLRTRQLSTSNLCVCLSFGKRSLEGSHRFSLPSNNVVSLTNSRTLLTQTLQLSLVNHSLNLQSTGLRLLLDTLRFSLAL
jgi:hypothetical protein